MTEQNGEQTVKQEKKKGGPAHLVMVNLLEKIVSFFQKKMTVGLLDFAVTWLYKIGHFGLLVAAALGFLFTMVFAIKFNSFNAFLMGIAWVILVFVVQYTAHRFSDAGEGLIRNNPTTLSSKAFLDCLGFLALIGGVVFLIMSIVRAIQIGSFAEFLFGLGLFLLLEFLALIAFNPSTVSVEVTEGTSAGQEAIGIITFFLKGVMRLIPIFFGVGVVIGTVLLFLSFLKLFGDQAAYAMGMGSQNATYILFSGLLPFASYIFFVLYYLVIDMIRAILSIPELKNK